MRLRLAWGGGAARVWEARATLSEGKFEDVRLLGLEADAAGAISQTETTVLVRPASPRAYDGFDVTVSGPLTAKLNVDLAPLGDGRKLQQVSIPLGDLVNDTSEISLDTTGNRLVIRRAPGDRLRVACARSHLVFSPGEKLKLDVQPHLIGFTPGEVLNCELRVLTARGGTEHSRVDRALLVGPDGVAAATGEIEVAFPQAEGAYDIAIELKRPGRTRFLPGKVLTQRLVQAVVVSPQPPAAPPAPWETVAEIDPASPNWWNRMVRLPGLGTLPGFAHGPLSGGTAVQKAVEGKAYIALEPQAWHAYPLAISAVGQPHVLEVELPPGMEQTLGVSLLEPNAAGKVIPLALDSGINVPGSAAAPGGPNVVHRLVFWPRTTSPLVVLANRRDDRPALFGKLRTLAGPALLPAHGTAPTAGERIVAASFERPALAANFSATDTLDPAADRNLDDWTTFLESATRLAQYLRYSGYNAAVVPILHEGGTLYPSSVVQGTARHDTGIFFSTGQDLRQKDVVELLLRVFDREGLRLIPALQFSSPLTELELLRLSESDREGIELLDSAGNTWRELNGGRQALGPIYNPLDDRVQQAMANVAREVMLRYGTHPAFAGISLQLGPETFAQASGAEWGFDSRTVRRFEAATRLEVPRGPRETAAVRAHFLLGSQRPAWLKWRAENLARFYGELADEMSKARRDTRLFLATGELPTVAVVNDSLRPALPRRGEFAEGLLGAGIDPALYARRENLVLFRPRREAPLISLARQSNLIELDMPEIDEPFSRHSAAGVQFFHEPLTQRLPALEEQSPFGAKNTIVYQAAQIVPALAENRRRLAHALARFDALTVFDGGWQLPLGQEAALSPLLATYRALPPERFTTVPASPDDDGSQPVVLRSLRRQNKSYVYCVNDFDSPVTVTVKLTGGDASMRSLSGRPLAAPVLRGTMWEWTLELDRYDLLAAEFAGNVQVTGWQPRYNSEALAELAARLREVRLRAEALADQPAYVGGFANSGFESPAQPDGSIAGWVSKRAPGLSATADAEVARNGSHSLRLKSDRHVLWVRSAPFAPPRTGRLAVVVWLKSLSEMEQPPLRLAIEARVNGQTYYRFAAVGAGQGASPLKTQWAPYVFQVDDLPQAGLSDLRIGFDLMGPGEVWIDDVELFDLWFYKTERDELAKLLALADFQLAQGKLGACRTMLEGYWPRFLETYVSPRAPRVAAQPARPGPGPGNSPLPATHSSSAEAEPASPKILDRMRGMLPRMPSLF